MNIHFKIVVCCVPRELCHVFIGIWRKETEDVRANERTGNLGEYMFVFFFRSYVAYVAYFE